MLLWIPLSSKQTQILPSELKENNIPCHLQVTQQDVARVCSHLIVEAQVAPAAAELAGGARCLVKEARRERGRVGEC